VPLAIPDNRRPGGGGRHRQKRVDQSHWAALPSQAVSVRPIRDRQVMKWSASKLPFNESINLHFDFVIQSNFVPRQSAEAPVVLWCLRNRYFNFVWQTISLFAYPLEQQSNQLFLGFDGTTFKHADLYDRIARTSASGVIEIIRFQVKKAVRSFVGWKQKCIDYT